jgi:hypothetical protein
MVSNKLINKNDLIFIIRLTKYPIKLFDCIIHSKVLSTRCELELHCFISGTEIKELIAVRIKYRRDDRLNCVIVARQQMLIHSSLLMMKKLITLTKKNN